MAFLSGGGHLKPNHKHVPPIPAAKSSSDEYEESDEEPEQIFQVRKIVGHIQLKRGSVRIQMREIPHSFDVARLEASKLPYAFKVRWRGYEEKDDTWEPIENFNTAMEKKLRKYCRKRNVKLPEGFREWMLPLSPDNTEADTSGSDHSDTDSRKKGCGSERNTTGSSTPSTSRPKAKLDKERLQQFKDDLALSPSPPASPQAQKRPRDVNKSIDHLFDSSDDEKDPRNGKKKKEGETSKSQFGTSNINMVTEKKRKTSRGESIDAEEKQRNKECKDKRKRTQSDRKRTNPRFSEENKKEEEEKKKKKERAALEEQAKINDIVKTMEEEERIKKEQKMEKMDKEKATPAESHKPKKVSFVNPPHDMMHDDVIMLSGDDEISAQSLHDSRTGDKPKDCDRVTGAERHTSFSDALMDPPSDAQNMSPYELEMKKRKRKQEEMMKEEDGEEENEVIIDGAKPLSNFRIPKISEAESEEPENREREEESEGEEDEEEDEKVDEEVDEEEEVEEEEEEDARIDQAERIAKAMARRSVLDQRMSDFSDLADEKERQRSWDWQKEEETWRRGMYERGVWRKRDTFRDMPFDMRADQRQSDMRHVRTLRRSISAECLPHSFRRLSSIHSMNSMASEADSLAAALTEIQVGETAMRLREQRERKAERIRRERERDEATWVRAPERLDIKGKTELFISETQTMVNELMPGMASEQTI
ncbi:hypothetical protein PENTCL1PPCAC_19005, partial [Pristionchus entomophagus]